MKKLLFIYNSHAGKARIISHMGQVLQAFQEEGYLTTVYATQGKGDGVWAAAAMAEEFDHIVCCGGDGTLSEVIAGLQNRNYHKSIGYIPAGTTNDFSKTLMLPLEDMVAAAQLAVTGRPQLCDVGLVNGNHILTYVAAFGAFSDTSYATPQAAKNMLGRTAYVLEGIRSLATLKPCRLKVTWDGGVLEDDFIYGMVSNSISVGGFKGLVPEKVVLDDGLFEVLLVRLPKNVKDLNQIAGALMSHQSNENFISLQTRQIRFESEHPVDWTVDGEFGGALTEMHIQNMPRHVTILSGRGEEEEAHEAQV